jgi:hypothetical protein
MYVKKIANIFGVLEKIKKIEERLSKIEETQAQKCNCSRS